MRWRHLIILGKADRAFRRGEVVCDYPPIRFWIEPTNHCNLRCPMCPRSLPEDEQPEKGFMDLDFFESLVDEISGYAWDIHLYLGGESLLHPNFLEMVHYVKKKGLRLSLSTNGTLLDSKVSKALLKAEIDNLLISFDGYDKQTYEKLRPGAEFDKTLDNIIGFLRLKKDRKVSSFTCLQCLDIAESEKKINEKKRFLNNFKNLPLDRFVVKETHDWGGNIELNEINNKPEGDYTPCNIPWYSMAITWDGRVVPCCDDLLNEYKIGNAHEEKILDLWNSKNMINLRKALSEGRYEEVRPCADCNKLWNTSIHFKFLPFGSQVLSVLFGYRKRKYLSFLKSVDGQKMDKEISVNYKYYLLNEEN